MTDDRPECPRRQAEAAARFVADIVERNPWLSESFEPPESPAKYLETLAKVVGVAKDIIDFFEALPAEEVPDSVRKVLARPSSLYRDKARPPSATERPVTRRTSRAGLRRACPLRRSEPV